jgi:hypothetical protein
MPDLVFGSVVAILEVGALAAVFLLLMFIIGRNDDA